MKITIKHQYVLFIDQLFIELINEQYVFIYHLISNKTSVIIEILNVCSF